MGGCVAWTVAKGELLTIERKQGIEVNDFFILYPSLFVMCKFDGESVDHLFLYCMTARDLWSVEYFSMFFFRVSWVVPKFIIEFWHVGENFQKNVNAATWKVMPLCMMWSSWRERNARMFEAKKKKKRTLVTKLK